jgi:hypothetical protein
MATRSDFDLTSDAPKNYARLSHEALVDANLFLVRIIYLLDILVVIAVIALVHSFWK